MNERVLRRANVLKEQIENHEQLCDVLKGFLRRYEHGYLRIFSRNGKLAASLRGSDPLLNVETPVDMEFVKMVTEYVEKQLADFRAEFDAL